ncbi:hypothetical protein [Natrarchaeobaculum aegyptiacum]|uniref:Molybdopterin cofactor biosynthesis MoaD-related C-terminal domain-containing protein n=1 Tax=Natrarchaeobaculum aegyptiacum TaxID=745377 RepID=A0A2Z2HR41_9EURY|nr:hypothetical protein [Natrarchaeobaculum aegyptiacum]ARS89492.1 hypothetical protein B1756_06850 [Natrarchaeobaculum aegyptiacum]
MVERLERSFRGISTRLAVRYLERLGGTCLDGDGAHREGSDDADGDADGDADDDAAADDVEAVVTADEWTASITSRSVEIGPTLTLTEVIIVFEGDSTVLEALLERFEQKAMRAGG